MLQVSEARELLLSNFSPCSSEQIHFSSALARVLSKDIHSENDSPGFTHSAMDGIALRSSDLKGAGEAAPITVNIVGKSAAGDHPEKGIRSGEGMLIMTGAMTPPGADTVVRVEDSNLDFSLDTIPSVAQIFHAAEQGENIRLQAENYGKGSLILHEGKTILPQDLGMLAMLGQETVSVFKQPRIGIFSSGDELVEPGIPLNEGQIWNSNSYMLSSLVKSSGGQVEDLGIIPDNESDILAAFERLVSVEVDLILTSGGVSMGVHDYVRRVIEEHGEIDFWKVNMRPGKPLAFGKFQGARFIGLPGNPVSSFVAFIVFVKPAIEKMAGLKVITKNFTTARLEMDIISDGRESYLPGNWRIDGEQLRVELTGNQSSGNLYALVQANCLIKIPAGVQSLSKDSVVDIHKRD